MPVKLVLALLLTLLTTKAHGQNVEQARQLARDIVARAYNANSTPRSVKALFNRVYPKLSNPIRVPSRGQDFSYCVKNPNTLAFTQVSRTNEMFLCARLLSRSEDEIAQIIIHEAAHLAGFIRECDAARIELGAVRRAGATEFPSGYSRRCGIR